MFSFSLYVADDIAIILLVTTIFNWKCDMISSDCRFISWVSSLSNSTLQEQNQGLFLFLIPKQRKLKIGPR